MDISEQVKELREYADGYKKSDFGVDGIVKILYQAAGTIESLSTKLAANSGWIPCSERLPEEPFGCLVTVIDTEPMTQTDFESILPYHVGYDGKQWNDIEGNRIPFEVIAWMYVPKEPYNKP